MNMAKKFQTLNIGARWGGCQPCVHWSVSVSSSSEASICNPTEWEVFVRLWITVCTLHHYKHPCSSNLLHLQPEPRWLKEWTQVQIRCCWNDSGYRTQVYLFCKTAAAEPVQVLQGTSWDHHPLLNLRCSSETPSPPNGPTDAPETESRSDWHSILH